MRRAGSRWRPFAGGTDLMVLLEAGKLAETKYVSLWGLTRFAASWSSTRRSSSAR